MSIFGQERFEISVGTSRVFQANGDYGFQAYDAAFNVNLNPKWSIGVSVIGGKSKYEKQYSYQFLQPAVNVFWTPFPMACLGKLRLGSGIGYIFHNPWYSGGTIDNINWTYEYDKESSSAIAFTFSIEYQVPIYKSVYAGAKVFGMPGVQESSLIWGAGLKLGVRI